MSHIKNLESLESGYPIGSILFTNSDGTPTYDTSFGYTANTIFQTGPLKFDLSSTPDDATIPVYNADLELIQFQQLETLEKNGIISELPQYDVHIIGNNYGLSIDNTPYYYVNATAGGFFDSFNFVKELFVYDTLVFTSSTLDAGDNFGIGILPNSYISQIAMVGAPNDNNISPDAGAIYLLRDMDDDGTMDTIERLTPPSGFDPFAGRAGITTSFYDSESHIVAMGAPLSDWGGYTNNGEVFLFYSSAHDESFSYIENIRPATSNSNDYFGQFVCASPLLTGNKALIAISASRNTNPLCSVHLYEFDFDTLTTTFITEITDPVVTTGNWFGSRTFMVQDMESNVTMLMVVDKGEDTGGANYGALYFYSIEDYLSGYTVTYRGKYVGTVADQFTEANPYTLYFDYERDDFFIGGLIRPFYVFPVAGNNSVTHFKKVIYPTSDTTGGTLNFSASTVNFMPEFDYTTMSPFSVHHELRSNKLFGYSYSYQDPTSFYFKRFTLGFDTELGNFQIFNEAINCGTNNGKFTVPIYNSYTTYQSGELNGGIAYGNYSDYKLYYTKFLQNGTDNNLTNQSTISSNELFLPNLNTNTASTITHVLGFVDNYGLTQKIPVTNIQDGNGLISALPADDVSIDANNNSLTFENLQELDINNNHFQIISDLTAYGLTKEVASNYQTNDNFGISVDISDIWVIVGAPNEDTGASNAGAAYIYQISSSTLTEMQMLTASDAQADDVFGYKVSISGDWALVGAYGEDELGSLAGAAYVFHNSGDGIWIETQKLTASDGATDCWFGWDLKIFGDWIIVGAPREDTGGIDKGAAYVFYNSGGTWVETQKLVASDGMAGDIFGWSVNLSNNSDFLVVGAHFEDTDASNSGAAYVFYNSGDTWVEIQKVKGFTINVNDNFGIRTSISTNYLAVSAVDDNNTNFSCIYIYYNSGDNVWTESQKLVAEQTGTTFITSTLNETGFLLVGDYLYNGESGVSGKIYLYQNVGGVFVLKTSLYPVDDTYNSQFGYAVAQDGDNIIIGAPNATISGQSGAGAIYFYKTQSRKIRLEGPIVEITDIETFENPTNILTLDSNNILRKSNFNEISPYTFVNGLTESGYNVKLGGNLTENTDILGENTYSLLFSGLTTFQAKTDSYINFEGANFFSRSSGSTVLYGNYGLSGETAIGLIGDYIDLDSYITRQIGTGAFRMPIGDTSERPSALYLDIGLIRFNEDEGWFEGYDGVQWQTFGFTSGGGPTYTFNNGLTLTGSTVQLGGALTEDTIVEGGDYGLTVTRNSISQTALTVENIGVSSAGIDSTGTLYGVRGYSPQAPLVGINTSTGASSALIGLSLQRGSYAGAVGNGIYIDMYGRDDTSSPKELVRIYGIMTDVGTSTASSRLDLHTRNNDSLARKLSLSAAGQLTLDAYGDGTFSGGTATKWLAVDLSGNVIETSLSSLTGGTEYAFQNGLTLAGSTVQLGGTLIKDTTIDINGFYFNISYTGQSDSALYLAHYSADTAVLVVEGNSYSRGIDITTNSGSTIIGHGGVSEPCAQFTSVNNLAQALYVQTTSGVVDTIVPILSLTLDTPVDYNGAGGSIDYYAPVYGNSNQHELLGRLSMVWFDSQSASRTSRYEVWLVDNTLPYKRMSLMGDGQLTLDSYGDGTFTGTTSYFLGTDVDGNIIEISPAIVINPSRSIQTVFDDYSATTFDYTILVNASGSDITITLPDPTTCEEHIFNVKALDMSNTITVSTPVGVIDSASDFTFGSQYQTLTIQSNGTNWYIL